MKTKHTKGEWTTEMTEIRCSIISNSFEDGKRMVQPIANLHWFGDETEANAKLIAAAPDLLEALNGLVELLSDETIDSVSLTAIRCQSSFVKSRQAIKKAIS